MFTKILVAIDRSDMSRQAFDTAISLARTTGTSLLLLHVLSPGDEECPRMPALLDQDFHLKGSSQSVLQMYEDLWKAYEERGLTFLQSLADEAIASGVTTELAQVIGNPGPVICECAGQSGSDLIIMGRQSSFGLNELVLGSVSNYVLHHAPCAVLVVHQQPETASTCIFDQEAATAS
jgi:nucleotide-binding universal stress UspA family protein